MNKCSNKRSYDSPWFTGQCLKNLCTDNLVSSVDLQQEQSLLSIPFTTYETAEATTKQSSNVDRKASSMKDSYTLLAEEMNKLSIQERERVYEDIHGVGKIVEETDELIAFELNKLDMEISKIKRKPAYNLAQLMSNQFVQDHKLRLMFLRSCRFDARKAAKKMIAFFEQKLQYFGTSKLTKSITLSDFDEEDLNCLKSGRFQLLPYRDRTGRAIVSMYLKQVYKYISVDSMIRALWYFLMAIAQDEETQRRGIIVLHFTSECHGSRDAPEIQLFQRSAKVNDALPFYVAGAHFSFRKPTLLSIISTLFDRIQGDVKIRTRFHYGSQTERLFSLMAFGIPIACLPITSEGELKVDNHLKWLQRRKVMERTILSGYVIFKGIDLPAKFDVLLGKGKPIQNHTGNMYLREIIDEYMVRYGKAKRGGKHEIANSIVEQIVLHGGRFLEQDKDGWWQEVSHETAIRKVCNRFRSQTAADNNNVGSKTRTCNGGNKRGRVL